jgi:hypothetical protein
MKGSLIPGILGGMSFLIFGIACLLWPEKIQEYALKSSTQGLGKYWHPFQGWVSTRSYVVTLRILGVISILASLLLFLAATEYRT